jgi:hypothetical protein
LSIATLRGSDDRCQIGSVPQYGDGGLLPSMVGALDGTLIWAVEFSRRSSVATMSELWMAP